MSLMKQIPTRQAIMLVMTARIQAITKVVIRAKTRAKMRAGMQVKMPAETAARILLKTVIDLSGAGRLGPALWSY